MVNGIKGENRLLKYGYKEKMGFCIFCECRGSFQGLHKPALASAILFGFFLHFLNCLAHVNHFIFFIFLPPL